MLANLEKWLESLDQTTFVRGRRYQSEGRVTLHTHTSNEVQAEVSGTSSEPYKVSLSLEGATIRGQCSCPIGVRCKHLAATGLHLLKIAKPVLASSAPPVKLSLPEELWLEQLQEEPQEGIDSNAMFVYLLAPVSNSMRELSVSLYMHKLKKNGQLSAATPKAYRLDQLLASVPSELRTLWDDSDWEAMRLLWQVRATPSPSYRLLLQKLVVTGRAFWRFTHEPPLRWGPEEEAVFEWVHQGHGQRSIRLLSVDDTHHCLIGMDGGVYIDEKQALVGPLRLPAAPERVQALLSGPVISEKAFPLVKKRLSTLSQPITIREKIRIDLPLMVPTPHLHLQWAPHQAIQASLSFQYKEHRVPCVKYAELHTDVVTREACYRIPRNSTKENEARSILQDLGFQWFAYPTPHCTYDSHALSKEEAIMDVMTLCVPQLRDLGWIVEIDESFPIQKVFDSDEWYATVSESQNNWFDLEVGSQLDGKRVNLVPQLRAFLSELTTKGFKFDALSPEQMATKVPLPIGEGEIVMIPMVRLRSLFETFFALLDGNEKGDRLVISPYYQGSELDASETLQWQAPERYRTLQTQFRQHRSIAKVSVPSTLQCQLRAYQIEGVSWLQFLRSCDLSGILADDMGLGKTVQALAHILLEKEGGRMQHPVLIVAPTTLMGNWLLETQRFAPHLKVLVLQGNQRKELFEQIVQHDLILTTYPLLARDQETLLKHEFHLLILDEAQNIKNSKTQAHQIIRQLRTRYRICLTGTPIENHLGELWSLFHVLLPGFLGSEKQFQKLFRKPIEKENSLERKKILQKRVQPFILRRTKQEVILELPPKTEILTPIALTEKQRDLYEAIRLALMDKVLAQVESKGLAKSRIIVLDALLKLRQICCDPRLVKVAKGVTAEDSAKLLHLRSVLPEMVQEKRQILLFSQFTSLLSLIEEELQNLAIPYVLITGETVDRITPVQTFQAGKVPLFLISLKAGGTGLNLTAADTVIHYDPWWNPAVESQATDRAHRMGQTKPVFVYKWIASGSVEEKILGLQSRKKELASALFDASNAAPLDLNLEDLQSLFEPL